MEASSTQPPLAEALRQPTESALPGPTSEPQAPEPAQEQPQPQDQYYPEQPTEFLPGVNRPLQEEVFFEWQSPSRPFKYRNRQYYTTVGMIVGLVALILLFAGQMLPVAVLLAVTFLLYIVNSVPPGMVTTKLTTYGVRIEDQLYYWEELGRFWFTVQHGADILHIEVGRFPFQLTILMGEGMSAEGMTEVLSEVLINEKPAPTTYEKMAQWLHSKIPIDLES